MQGSAPQQGILPGRAWCRGPETILGEVSMDSIDRSCAPPPPYPTRALQWGVGRGSTCSQQKARGSQAAWAPAGLGREEGHRTGAHEAEPSAHTPAPPVALPILLARQRRGLVSVKGRARALHPGGRGSHPLLSRPRPPAANRPPPRH